MVCNPTIHSLPELFNDYGTLDILEYFNPHEDTPDDKRVTIFTASDSVTLPPWTDHPNFDPGHKVAAFGDPFVIRQKAKSQHTAIQDSDFDESVYTPTPTPMVKPVISSLQLDKLFRDPWGKCF